MAAAKGNAVFISIVSMCVLSLGGDGSVVKAVGLVGMCVTYVAAFVTMLKLL